MGKRSRSEIKEPRMRMAAHKIKLVSDKASPCVVSLVSRNVVKVPVGTNVVFRGHLLPGAREVFFFACGIIIDCQSLLADNAKYLCTILAPANLFHRTHDDDDDDDDTRLHDIQIDVFVSGGASHKAKLLACDFHYNLAALTIESDTPLQTANLKNIDDTFSIDPTHHLHSFQLRPHSDLAKIVPGTKLVTLWRSFAYPHDISPASGSFSSGSHKSRKGLSCNELYEIDNDTYEGDNGGPVLNSLGETIGIVFEMSSFLPSNIISRWWNHYKSSGGFCRPFLGMEVANLYDADLDFLAQFITIFPAISTAVIVTKVIEDSPAGRSGICINDVIVKVDGKLVQSKMKFYESIWEKTGKCVELNVLRVTNLEELNVSLVVEEASPNEFHQWPYPSWSRRNSPENNSKDVCLFHGSVVDGCEASC